MSGRPRVIPTTETDMSYRTGRPEGQSHVQPHPRRHGESRFRAGRGRPGCRQSLGIRDDLLREAAVLRLELAVLCVRQLQLPILQQRIESQPRLHAPDRALPQLAGLVGSQVGVHHATDATTILGAGKVTGRNRNGLSVGVLDADHRRMVRHIPKASPGGTADQSEEIEPLANYFIGRLRKDFRGGATRVGTIATLVNRAMRTADETARLRSNAQAVGLDLDHHWANRAYSLNIQTALTNIGGDTAAISLAQQSSARYYPADRGARRPPTGSFRRPTTLYAGA